MRRSRGVRASARAQGPAAAGFGLTRATQVCQRRAARRRGLEVIQRRRISLRAALAIAALIAIHARAAEAGFNVCCLCHCGKLLSVCIGLSFDCDADCLDRKCDFEGATSCVGGTLTGCDSNCQPICPTDTPISTPTQTPTNTPTATPTITPTATPVPAGGSCTDTAQCAPGLTCQNNICTATAPAPATSPTGLLLYWVRSPPSASWRCAEIGAFDRRACRASETGATNR